MSAQLLEQFIPPIQSDGLNTNTNTALGGTLAVTGATTLASTLAVTGNATFSGSLVGSKKNVVDATAATTLTTAQSGSVVLFDSATGFQIKLPAAATGLTYDFVVAAKPTSGTIGISTNSASIFLAGATATGISASTSTSATFIADGTTTTLMSMNGTTTGGTVGTAFNATAISATVWYVSGNLVGSGALATPFA